MATLGWLQAPALASGKEQAREVLTLRPKALPGLVGEAVLLLSRVGLPAVLGRDCIALAPLRGSVAGSGCTCMHAQPDSCCCCCGVCPRSTHPDPAEQIRVVAMVASHNMEVTLFSADPTHTPPQSQ